MNLTGYFRTTPNSADLAMLNTARQHLADARLILGGVADHLRDGEGWDADTGGHPLTAAGHAVAELQADVSRILEHLDALGVDR